MQAKVDRLPKEWRELGMRATNIRELPGAAPESLAFYQCADDLEKALAARGAASAVQEQELWAVHVLDAWAGRDASRYYETDKMGFDADLLGVGRQWRCNCFRVETIGGREPRKVHIANGLSYESAAAARVAAAEALVKKDPSLAEESTTHAR